MTRGGRLRTLARHQLASLASTVVDFGLFVLFVRLVHLPPEAAVPIGAVGGAVTNFLLGRELVFRGSAGRMRTQMVRYALVSGASLLWNTGGEFLLFRVLGLNYLVARLLAAVVVSLAWNYPLQRNFVFPRSPEATTNR